MVRLCVARSFVYSNSDIIYYIQIKYSNRKSINHCDVVWLIYAVPIKYDLRSYFICAKAPRTVVCADGIM